MGSNREPPLRWPGALVPGRGRLEGRYVTLAGLDPRSHARPLFDATHDGTAAATALWTYLPYGPFADPAAFEAWLWQQAGCLDPVFLAILPNGAPPAGLASYLRIDPRGGAIEIGHLLFAPRLQRTRAATEAIFLLAAEAFERLGYRRLEWKCDARNAPSIRAAERFGFTYEGTFRQATVVRGRNRDTAWFAMLDHEWPERRAAFERWLDPANFDAEGSQLTPLAARTGGA
jgi:RimJ/RimL family protein N-acetyltransferase